MSHNKSLYDRIIGILERTMRIFGENFIPGLSQSGLNTRRGAELFFYALVTFIITMILIFGYTLYQTTILR